jgi:hypothetical protein
MSWRDERLPACEQLMLPYGNGRSYGDSCLNDNGTLLDMRGLDRFIHFDRITGVITCEAGVLFSQVLDLVVPAGWFPPVTPGTRLVTVGGAIANDVHGKNHHRAGTLAECRLVCRHHRRAGADRRHCLGRDCAQTRTWSADGHGDAAHALPGRVLRALRGV